MASRGRVAQLGESRTTGLGLSGNLGLLGDFESHNALKSVASQVESQPESPPRGATHVVLFAAYCVKITQPEQNNRRVEYTPSGFQTPNPGNPCPRI